MNAPIPLAEVSPVCMTRACLARLERRMRREFFRFERACRDRLRERLALRDMRAEAA